MNGNDAIRNLKEVLNQCKYFELTINWKMCTFLKSESNF